MFILWHHIFFGIMLINVAYCIVQFLTSEHCTKCMLDGIQLPCTYTERKRSIRVFFNSDHCKTTPTVTPSGNKNMLTFTDNHSWLTTVSNQKSKSQVRTAYLAAISNIYYRTTVFYGTTSVRKCYPRFLKIFETGRGPTSNCCCVHTQVKWLIREKEQEFD